MFFKLIFPDFTKQSSMKESRDFFNKTEEDLKDRYTMVSKILGLNLSSVQLRKYITITLT